MFLYNNFNGHLRKKSETLQGKVAKWPSVRKDGHLAPKIHPEEPMQRPRFRVQGEALSFRTTDCSCDSQAVRPSTPTATSQRRRPINLLAEMNRRNREFWEKLRQKENQQ